MGPKYFMNNDHRAKEVSPEVQAALHQIPLVPQTTTTEGVDREGQGCYSRGRVSVIKVDSDGASCQDVVCHVNRFLLLLLLLRRPAHASPAALGAARGLVQRPAHEDAAVQEHLLRWGHSGRVSAQPWQPLPLLPEHEPHHSQGTGPAASIAIHSQTGCSVCFLACPLQSAWLRSQSQGWRGREQEGVK